MDAKLTITEQERLKAILRHPELLAAGRRERDSEDCYPYPRKRFTRAIVERGNLRLRLRSDTDTVSVFVKVRKHHSGLFLKYDYDEWAYIDLKEEHFVWAVVRRIMPELEAEIKRVVDPPAVLEPAGSGSLSLMDEAADDLLRRYNEGVKTTP